MYALREINQMEREMCSYLEWQLNVEPSAFKEFESMVRKDFKGPGPRPARYTLSRPLRGHSRIQSRAPATFRPPSHLLGPEHLHPRPRLPPRSHRRGPRDGRWSNPIPHPQMIRSYQLPPASHSNVPSPANSMSPAIPQNYEGDSAKIVSSATSNTM